MKVEINWTPGPPTKVGKCLLAIRGSEDAIPGVVGESGAIWSWTNPAVKYDLESIAYHAAWPTFPRERSERWIECNSRTYEDWIKGLLRFDGWTATTKAKQLPPMETPYDDITEEQAIERLKRAGGYEIYKTDRIKIV